MHICITQPKWVSQVKHICAIGSSLVQIMACCQTITRTNVDLLSIGPLGTNFIEISNKIQLISFKKIDLKILSGTFCLGLNVDMTHHHTMCRLTFPTNTLISIDAVLTLAVLTTRIGGTLIDILQTIYAGESWRTNTLIIPFRVHTRRPISTGLTQRTLILICCAIGARPTLIKETRNLLTEQTDRLQQDCSIAGIIVMELWAVRLTSSYSLWPSDAIWCWRSWSTLVQVMACCPTTLGHYLTQFWPIISDVL